MTSKNNKTLVQKFGNIAQLRTFAGNNTCHASRKISALWQVFDFYRGNLINRP